MGILSEVGEAKEMKNSSQPLGGNNVCLFLSHWLKQMVRGRNSAIKVERGRNSAIKVERGETLLFFKTSFFYSSLRQYPAVICTQNILDTI